MAAFKIGDLVWAKMKGFPPWPGLITEPPEDLMSTYVFKKNCTYHCIYFFGSKDYSWIETEKLKSYLPHKDELSNAPTKSIKFRKACKEIEEFLKKRGEDSDEDGMNISDSEEDNDELEVEELEVDEQEVDEQEVDEQEVDEQEVDEQEVDELEFDEQEVDELEVDELEVDEQEVDEQEVNEQEDDELDDNEEEEEHQMEENVSTDEVEKMESSSSESSEDPIVGLLRANNCDRRFPVIIIKPLPFIYKKKSKLKPKKRSSSPCEFSNKKRKYYNDADTTTAEPSLDGSQPESPFSEDREYMKELSDNEFTSDNSFEENLDSERNEELSDDSSMHEEMIPSKKIGFLGMGVIGSGMVKNLLRTGHHVTIWNRTPDKVADLDTLGAIVAPSPQEVAAESDIIFCCVSDATASKEVIFRRYGVLMDLNPEKSYVDITSIDLESCMDVSEAVYSRGARFMEVRIQGSKKEADDGTLVCLAAGEKSLYDDCSSFFKACSKKSFFMGEAGNATKMQLVLQLMAGVALAGLGESMALADRAGLNQADFLKILSLSQMNCPLIMEKANAIHEGDFGAKMTLRNVQSDMRYALSFGDSCEQPTPMGATANELLKHAKKLGYGGHDVSAIFLSSRF